MSYQVEYVFFKVCTRTGNTVYFVATDHFPQGYAELCRAHGSGQSEKHLATFLKMAHVAFRGIDHRGRIEVPEMMLKKTGNRSLVHRFYYRSLPKLLFMNC